nr:metallopeptidase family protein [Angustibacter aerolatus]
MGCGGRSRRPACRGTAPAPSSSTSLVLDAVERLERRWSDELDGVEFAVEDVPPSDPAPWEHGAVPLGRFFPAGDGLPTRIVVYRRPVETRVEDRTVLPALVHRVVVEQVAHLLGVEPGTVDPAVDDDDRDD